MRKCAVMYCGKYVYLVTTSQRVEHVKEDKAGEGHGGVPRGHLAVFHRVFEHPKRASDNYRSRQ